MKLPGLRKLRDLKQNAGRRLRAALVPELRELPGLVTVLSATREDLERLGQRLDDARATLSNGLSDAETRIRIVEDQAYELDRRVERIEERGSDGTNDLDELDRRVDELDNRLDQLEGFELEDMSDLPERVAQLAETVQRLDEIRGALLALLR